MIYVVNYGIPAIMCKVLLDQVTAEGCPFQKKPKRGKLDDLVATGIRSYRIFEKAGVVIILLNFSISYWPFLLVSVAL